MIKTGRVTLGILIAAIAIASILIITSNKTTEEQYSHYTPITREFWLFNSAIPGFNEAQMGMPHDVFSMPTIWVFKGDTVVIHFFNTEVAGGDHHSFTIKSKPYSANVDLSPGQNRTITFDANTTGIFSYYCTFHQPTMRGQLIVGPPPY